MTSVEKYWSVNGIEPSFAEKQIARKLHEIHIGFKQEVCFESCRNSSTGNHLRFDFYLPDLNILIEYDGKQYHESELVKCRDSDKDRYARDWGIKLIRVSGLKNIDAAIKTISEIDKSRKQRRKYKQRAKYNKPISEPEIKPKKPKKNSRDIKNAITRFKAETNDVDISYFDKNKYKKLD